MGEEKRLQAELFVLQQKIRAQKQKVRAAVMEEAKSASSSSSSDSSDSPPSLKPVKCKAECIRISKATTDTTSSTTCTAMAISKPTPCASTEAKPDETIAKRVRLNKFGEPVPKKPKGECLACWYRLHNAAGGVAHTTCARAAELAKKRALRDAQIND